MKNTQRGFIGIIVIVIVALAVIGGGAYIYSAQKAPVEIANTQVDTITTGNPSITGLSDAAFKAAVEDPDAKILAKGDVNGDGYEDAVVQEIRCGASCSVSLQVILNERNMTANLLKDKNYPDTFSPAYLASSAVKSNVTSVSIKNGVISLTGNGLACVTPNSEGSCTKEKWSVIKTATYKFDGLNIVQLSVKP